MASLPVFRAAKSRQSALRTSDGCRTDVSKPPFVKLAFHDADTDTDILARILADTSDTRDFLKLFLWQAKRHADILATIFARMSVSVSVSASWNVSFTSPSRGSLRSNCMMSMYVCLFVSLSARVSQKPHSRTSHQFPCTLTGAVSLCLPLVALRCVTYFRCCGRRHIFTCWARWRSTRIPQQRQYYVTAETPTLIPTEFCASIKTRYRCCALGARSAICDRLHALFCLLVDCAGQ